MHAYELEGRGQVVVAIMGVSVLLVWVLHIGLGAMDFDPQWWLSVPSFAGCYSGLHWLFDRYLWRLGLLRELKLIHLPDLNGSWVGEVESSYSQDGPAHPVSVVILCQRAQVKCSGHNGDAQRHRNPRIDRLSPRGRLLYGKRKRRGRNGHPKQVPTIDYGGATRDDDAR